MLLAIDIGNTNTVIGVFQQEKLIDFFRLSTRHSLTVDDCGVMINQLLSEKKKRTKGVIICSVVPCLTSVFQGMSKKYLRIEPVIVNYKLPLGIKILYEDPSQVGADRIANAVAAYQIYGGPAIIVDLGTATTFDVISKKGEYLGGAIAPGLEVSIGTLVQKAAQLLKIELKKPKDIIGKSTEESLRSGIFYGTLDQIEGIVKRIKKKISGKVKVIATGGLASLIASESETIEEIDPSLTLKGLNIIYKRIRD
ncbi:MAG: type III pantothenate kinase [Candidatus Zixiibacteriota bacterium]